MKDSVLQFGKPVLKEVEYRIIEEFDADKKVHLHRHLQSDVFRSEDDNEAIVELTIQIGCDDRSVNQPFALKLTIGASFKWDDSLENNIVEELLQINAPALLVGYARPIISNITSSSIGQYDLPFINFAE